MKKNQLTALLVVFLFINIASISLISTTTGSTPEEILDTEPLIIDDTPDRFAYDINFKGLTTSSLTKAAAVGDVKTFLSLDDYMGYYFFTDFELRAESPNTEIWVQLDRSYPVDDVRNNPAYQDEDGFYYYPEITDAQIAYLLAEFDDNIYPQDTLYYGAPDYHDGSASLLEALGYVPPGYYYDETGKNIILVSNVRDAAYYEGFRFYIAGFFSSTIERYIDRNIISIDSHQWYRRIGPEGYVWHSEVLGMDYPPVDRPHLYEGTIAHEYQHLLHSDYVPGDLLIMNEGFSTFAEYLCGYGVPTGDINYFLATPDNSLTEWGDQEGDNNILADYGQAFMWTAYISDHFGGPDFLSYYMEVGMPGFAGVENALNYFGFDLTFDEVFHDWRIANLIHTDWPGNGKYNYDTFDLGDEDIFIPIRVYDLEDNVDYDGSHWPKDLTGYGFGHTVCWDDFPLYETYYVSSYASDYIRFGHNIGGFCGFYSLFSTFEFNGDDSIILPTWIKEDMDDDGDLEWYSTPAGPEADMQMFIEVDLSAASTLTFDTYYDIELLWDYGFVQVSTDQGATWTSLANEYTTLDHDPSAYPDIIDNLPGLTGVSDGWMTMSFDLTPYAGQTVWIGFRYMTDWGTERPGFWVDNIYIGDILVEDADTTDAVFFPIPPLIDDFMVTLIREDHVRYWYRRRAYYRTIYTFIYDMVIDENNDGTAWLSPFLFGGSNMIAIITPLNGPADYSFSINKYTWFHCR
ncbi:MAG: hypothetical protein ACFFAQ_01000 [Promethearchaeota archaeon]